MLELVVILIILGIVAYGVQHLPIPAPFNVLIYCILAIFAVVLCARALGVATPALG